MSLIGTEKWSTGYEKVLAAVNAIKQAGARTEGSRRGADGDRRFLVERPWCYSRGG